MGKTLITVKEDIIFRPTSYNHTLFDIHVSCVQKQNCTVILRRKVLVKLVPLDFDCSYINIDIR